MNDGTLSINSSIAEIRVSEDGENRIRALAGFLSKYLNRKVNPIMLMLAKNVSLEDVLERLNISVTDDVEEMMDSKVLY